MGRQRTSRILKWLNAYVGCVSGRVLSIRLAVGEYLKIFSLFKCLTIYLFKYSMDLKLASALTKLATRGDSLHSTFDGLDWVLLG